MWPMSFGDSWISEGEPWLNYPDAGISKYSLSPRAISFNVFSGVEQKRNLPLEQHLILRYLSRVAVAIKTYD